MVEVHNLYAGLYDDRGCLIEQTSLGATEHTGVMSVYGRNLLQYFPPETFRPGDVFICNDPWICNGQTADVFITTPAFRGERLIGFSINSVHHIDIGGRKGSGLSEEVYEEGTSFRRSSSTTTARRTSSSSRFCGETSDSRRR